MKKPLAALALAAAAVATLALPAGAAVPKSKPTDTLPCTAVINSRQHVPAKGSVSVWFSYETGTLAVKNPCAAWVALGWGTDGPGVPVWALFVAPHASFSWKAAGVSPPGRTRYVGPKQPLDWAPGPYDQIYWPGWDKYSTPTVTQYTYGKLVYSTKKVRDPKTAPM